MHRRLAVIEMALGNRDAAIEQLLQKLTGSEAATVVNNNAAATAIVLNTVAEGKEVTVLCSASGTPSPLPSPPLGAALSPVSVAPSPSLSSPTCTPAWPVMALPATETATM